MVFIQRKMTKSLHCAFRFHFRWAYLKLDPKNTLRNWANFVGFRLWKCLFFRYTHPKRNLSAKSNIPVYCLWINTQHAYVWIFKLFWRNGGKIVVTFEPIMQFFCPSRFRILKTILTHSVAWKKTKTLTVSP